MLNNPTDHKHGDYAGAIAFTGILSLTVSMFCFLVLVFGNIVTEDDLDDRLNSIECSLAEDEVECLRDLVGK